MTKSGTSTRWFRLRVRAHVRDEWGSEDRMSLAHTLLCGRVMLAACKKKGSRAKLHSAKENRMLVEGGGR